MRLNRKFIKKSIVKYMVIFCVLIFLHVSPAAYKTLAGNSLLEQGKDTIEENLGYLSYFDSEYWYMLDNSKKMELLQLVLAIESEYLGFHK